MLKYVCMYTPKNTSNTTVLLFPLYFTVLVVAVVSVFAADVFCLFIFSYFLFLLFCLTYIFMLVVHICTCM